MGRLRRGRRDTMDLMAANALCSYHIIIYLPGPLHRYSLKDLVALWCCYYKNVANWSSLPFLSIQFIHFSQTCDVFEPYTCHGILSVWREKSTNYSPGPYFCDFGCLGPNRNLFPFLKCGPVVLYFDRPNYRKNLVLGLKGSMIHYMKSCGRNSPIFGRIFSLSQEVCPSWARQILSWTNSLQYTVWIPSLPAWNPNVLQLCDL